MLDGPTIAQALKESGFSHVIWVPDSSLGAWDASLAGALPLIRVCREGEAFGLAAGLILGGKNPIVILQCTGLFEAGDTLRNVVFDMHLPVMFLVGVRNYFAHRQGKTTDSCPVFTEPILRAWQIPYVVLDDRNTGADLAAAYRKARAQKQAFAVLLAE